MEKDLKLQKLIKITHGLVIRAIVIGFIYISMVLYENCADDHKTAIYSSSVWMGVLEIIFQVIVLFLILNQKNNRTKSITNCFLLIGLILIITDIIYLVISPLSLSHFLSFIMDTAGFILFMAFYQKTKGKQPVPQLAYGLLAVWVLLCVLNIHSQIDYTQSAFFVIFSIIMYVISYFTPFVLYWIACMSIVNEGFYKNFIEARPKIPIQEIQKTGAQD